MFNVIDANPGETTSNSYVTLAEANAIMNARLHTDAWLDLPDQKKIASLIWATNTIDTFHFIGRRGTQNQALLWPRTGVCDPDGYTVDPLVIPQFLKLATVEQAFSLAQTDRTVENTEGNYKKLKIDTLEIENFSKQTIKSSLEVSANNYLTPYLSGGGSLSMVRKVERM